MTFNGAPPPFKHIMKVCKKFRYRLLTYDFFKFDIVPVFAFKISSRLFLCIAQRFFDVSIQTNILSTTSENFRAIEVPSFEISFFEIYEIYAFWIFFQFFSMYYTKIFWQFIADKHLVDNFGKFQGNQSTVFWDMIVQSFWNLQYFWIFSILFYILP